MSRRSLLIYSDRIIAILVLPHAALAHNVSRRDASFGVAIAAFMYLGAKHMVTGYDYVAFLVGVIFFLYALKDIAQKTIRNSNYNGLAATLRYTPTSRSTVLVSYAYAKSTDQASNIVEQLDSIQRVQDVGALRLGYQAQHRDHLPVRPAV